MTLPRGMSEKDFSAALREFAQVVGSDWVLSSEQDLDGYCDEFGPYRGTPQEVIPGAAVAPDDTRAVQEIVRIANQYRVPLWVISGGRNYGYGGAAPRLAGSVVLDLKRMNRILEVNEQHAYALVEPGVSSMDLYNHIQAKGYKLWMDGPSPGWASIVGSTLERALGHGLLPERWNYQCGMEVVLPDGDLIRTGMGAIPGSQTWQQYKWGFGPYVDGLFSQSNLGIVTKLGTWLMPEPPATLFGIVTAPRQEDLITLIDTIRPLRLSGILTSAGFARIDPQGDGGATGRGGARATVSIYGPEKVIGAHWDQVQEICAVIPGVRFDVERYAAPYDTAPMSDLNKRRHCVMSMAERKSWDHGFMYLSHLVPFDGKAAWKMMQVFDGIYQQHGLRFRGGFSTGNSSRALMCSQRGGFVRKGDAEFNRKSMDLVRRVTVDGGRQGYGVYRITTVFMDEAMAAFDFNDGALRRFHETLKDALDPNGILAAGKSGIWPEYLRGSKS